MTYRFANVDDMCKVDDGVLDEGREDEAETRHNVDVQRRTVSSPQVGLVVNGAVVNGS